jgi:biopolymer transport protein ExbB/TolQ
MEDKKTFLVFIILGGILNLILIILMIRGLATYLSNLSNIEKNRASNEEFNNLTRDLIYKIDVERPNLSKLKEKFNSETSVSSYLEKLTIRTNEKNVQLYKNTILSSSDNEILMNAVLYGTLTSITSIVEEIENELPLSEITNSTLEKEGDYFKANLSIRILIDK